MEHIVGLKELRENLEVYVREIEKGKSFTVVRRSKPLFKVAPLSDDEVWESVIDFTKIKRGGVPIANLLARL